MSNNLVDLNNLLFAQLNRLSNEDLSQDDLARELERTKAVTSVANSLINNGKLLLDATKFSKEYIVPKDALPELLQQKKAGDGN